MGFGAESRAHWRKVKEMDDHQFSGLLAKEHNITS